MAKFPLPPTDARGRRVRKGARVRIVGVPDLSNMSEANQAECEPIFRHIHGTCRRVEKFDRYGLAVIFFKIRTGRLAGWHSVNIEPYLLLVQREHHGA
ncbi:MAG TPA: hypothetical protein VGL11_07780 [Candidatus Binatia bacterium]|jgi:hypothetical protein